MKRKIYEVKAIEECYDLAVEELGVSKEEISFNVLSEKKGFLGIGGKLEVEAVVDVDGIQKGKDYIQMILDNNGFEGYIEKRVRDNQVEFDIDCGDNNGYLIGKNARTLISLQSLVSTVINNYYDEDEKYVVLIDVNGYKKKREKRLERMAVDFGKEVARTKQSIKLSDLNAYERKIIHNKLSTWKDVETHSEGVEPNRCLIIEYKK